MVDDGQDCGVCHQSEFLKATQPLHVGVISEDCAGCHSNARWAPARGSDHSFALDGAHELTPCNACHVGQPVRYEGTDSRCVACHGEERDQVDQPSHEGFSDDCTSCHGSQGWQPATLEHEWPLEGAHARADCSSCHLGEPPVYQGTPTDCSECHRSDRERVTEPSHEGFPSDCAQCHDSEAFRPALFPEHEWPLEGAHASASCESCHTGEPPRYAGTPSECLGCHQSDRDAVVEPPHDRFSDACETCHGTASWSGADFQHVLSFPLRGAHATADCTGCHVGSPAIFAGTGRDCVDCHQEDYDAAPLPGHDEFPTTCEDCHTESAWTPATGAHPEDRFSTRGDHDYACNDCHDPSLGPNGAGNANCVGCHEGEHTLSRMAGEHDDVRDYPRGGDPAPNFCLECHPGGRE